MSDLDYRSWGTTKNCHGCRYWSEMFAEVIGGGPLMAMCLHEEGAKYAGKMTTQRQTCEGWEEGSLGAVDSPGGNPYEYEKMEGGK